MTETPETPEGLRERVEAVLAEFVELDAQVGQYVTPALVVSRLRRALVDSTDDCPHDQTVDVTSIQDAARGRRKELCQLCSATIASDWAAG